MRITNPGLTTAQTASLALADTALQPDDVGTLATQNSDAVSVTGGDVSVTNLTATAGTYGGQPSKTTIYSYPMSAGNFGTAGMPTVGSQGSAAAMAYTTNARYYQTSTGTTATAQAGAYNVSTGILTSNFPWTAFFRFRTGSTLANQGLWIGITNSQAAFNSANPPTNSLLARFIYGTDTKLTATGRAAGSQTIGSAFGPTLLVSTAYTVRLRFDGTSCFFSAYAGEDLGGDFGTEVAMNTVPAVATALGYQLQAGNTVGGVGTSSDFAWSLVQVTF